MIEINGDKYEAMMMTPREQMHVLRRLTPLVGTMGEGVLALLDDSKNKADVFKTLAAQIGPLTEAIAFLPDELVDYVLDTCLTHVRTQRPGADGWFPIYVRSGKTAVRMYKDIDGMLELRLVSEVIKENLSGFFAQLSGVSASRLSATGQAPASNI